jgi:ribosomal subunit interface protein
MIRKILKSASLSITPAIEQAAEKVFSSIENYVDPNDTSAIAEIEVSRTTHHHRSGEIFRAEINFHHRHGDIRAESEKEDLYVALSAIKDEILESLRIRKSKRVHFVKRSGLALKQMLRGFPWKKRN